jgi:hypothetical protein
MTRDFGIGLENHRDCLDDPGDQEGSASHQREDVKVRQQVIGFTVDVTELYRIVL